MIKNGKDTKLNESTGTLPDVSGAMLGWFQKMTVEIICKTIINFRVVETLRTVNFSGVIQPFTDQQINMMPIGQRAWRWYTLHAETSLDLKIDDVMLYSDVKYRVQSKANYNKYGYVKYNLVEDFEK